MDSTILYLSIGIILVFFFIFLMYILGVPLDVITKYVYGKKKSETKLDEENIPDSKRFFLSCPRYNFREEVTAKILSKHDDNLNANVYRFKYKDNLLTDFEVIDHPSFLRPAIGVVDTHLSEKKAEYVYEEEGIEQYLTKHKAMAELHSKAMEKELMDAKDGTVNIMKKEAETRKETRKASGWSPFQGNSTYRPWRFGQQPQGEQQDQSDEG